MPDRKAADSETEAPTAAAPVEAAAPAKQAQFTDQGPVPKVGGTDTAAKPTASDRAFGGDIESGMHDPAAYKAALDAAGKSDKWNEKYVAGHTSATQFIQPYEGRYAMEWKLKKGQSASQAVKDFVKGPTIADYKARGVAADMDELRDDFGDNQFDKLFGSRDADDDAAVPAAHRLQIGASMYTIPFADQMRAMAASMDVKKAPMEQPEEAPEAQERVEKPKAVEETPVMSEAETAHVEREVV